MILVQISTFASSTYTTLSTSASSSCRVLSLGRPLWVASPLFCNIAKRRYSLGHLIFCAIFEMSIRRLLVARDNADVSR